MKTIFSLLPLFIAAYFSGSIYKVTKDDKSQVCALTAINAKDTSQYATFFVYRSKKWKYHVDVYSVNVGDSIVYRIKSNTKHAVKIYKEGPVRVWAKSGGKEVSLNFNVEFGKDYYIKCTINPGFAMGYPELGEMSLQEGKKEWDAIVEK